MGFEIRAGSRDDAAGIAAVHVASWRAGYAGVVPDSVLYSDEFEASRQRMWGEWRFNPGQRVSVCVRDGDDIVGFAAYGPERMPEEGVSGRGELYALLIHEYVHAVFEEALWSHEPFLLNEGIADGEEEYARGRPGLSRGEWQELLDALRGKSCIRLGSLVRGMA